MGKITQLKYNGEVAYPLTHTTAVVNNDGETLEQLLQNNSNTTTIIDNLESDDKTAALSANMGRVLNEKFHYSNYLEDVMLKTDGSIVAAVGWKVTEPIMVQAQTALTFESGSSSSSAICEYDADGNFLDYWNQSAHPRTITTKANTAYVRMTIPAEPTYDYYINQEQVTLFNQLKTINLVEDGVVASDTEDCISTLITRQGTVYPRTKAKAVIDENGKDIESRLSEMASGILNLDEYEYITTIEAPFEATNLFVAKLSDYEEVFIQLNRPAANASLTGWIRPFIGTVNKQALFSYITSPTNLFNSFRLCKGDNLAFAEQWTANEASGQKAVAVERTCIWDDEFLLSKLDEGTSISDCYFGIQIPSTATDGTEKLYIWGKPKDKASLLKAVSFAPQTLTDEQKLQVAKNIGQTERLILEWSNEDAEVLQPTAYDAATGYFTTDKMPSWLAEDGVSVNAVINYTDAILSGNASSKNVVIGSDAGRSTLYVQRINETQFLCHVAQTDMTAATVPSTVDVSLFYFTNTVNSAFQLLKEGETSPTIGIRKFHIRIMDIAARESRYTQLWLNGNPRHVQGSNTYTKYPVATIGHFTNKCFGTTADMEVWVDYGAEGGPRGKFVRIDSNGAYFDNQQNIAYYTNPTMYSEWGNMWGFSGTKQCYLKVTALGKRATVRITEIIE